MGHFLPRSPTSHELRIIRPSVIGWRVGFVPLDAGPRQSGENRFPCRVQSRWGQYMFVLDQASALYKGVKGIPRKLFGTRNDRLLKVYNRRVEPINGLEDDVRGDYDERFARRIDASKKMPRRIDALYVQAHAFSDQFVDQH